MTHEAAARYDTRAQDCAKTIAHDKIDDGHRGARGYQKPGSRKKVY